MRNFLPTLLIALFLFAAGLTVFTAMKTTSRPLQALRHLRPPDAWWLGRNYPYIGEGTLAWQKAVAQGVKDLKKRNANTPWTLEGPHNIGGRINCIAIHPTNPQIFYIGTPAAGIFKTSDGGNTWTQHFTQQNSLAIGALVIDPQNPDILYAGTGDKALSSFTFLGSGLYKSTDAGLTWNLIGLSSSGVISKILIHPQQPNTLYVATMGNIYTQDNNRGLYKTTDGGLNWSQILFLGQTAGIGDLVMDNAHPDTLFAAGRNRRRANFFSTVSGPAARIYRTYNGGLSWDTLSTGLPAGPQTKITLALSQNNPQLVYAAYCDTSSEYAGFYRSQNGGNSWSLRSNDANMSMGGFGWYFGEIRINPSNDNMVYWMGIDFFRSTNGGSTFSKHAPDWYTYEVHADKHDLQFINANTLLLATDGGLFKSSSGGGSSGSNWTYISEIPITQYYRVAYNPFDTSMYYGGAQDNGTQTGSAASGLMNWMRYFGGDGFQPGFDTTDPDIFYTETQRGDIYATTDGGSNFDPVSSSISSNERCNWNTPYVLSKHSPQTMYTGSYRVYKNITSTVDNWNPISPDLTDGTSNEQHTISALSESPLQPGLIYAGTSDHRVWVTQNDGLNWTAIYSGMPARYVSCVKASPDITGGVFLSYWGYRDNDSTAHIFYSSNFGNSWNSIAGSGLPDFAISDIWIQPGHGDSNIVIANDGGVYATQNRGVNWFRVGNNMPLIPVFDVEYNPALKRLFAGTFAMGIQSIPIDSIFKTKDPVINVGFNTPLFNSLQFFPNPFTDWIAIHPENQLDYQIRVIGANGQTLLYWPACRGQLRIPTRSWIPGNYWIVYDNGLQRKTIQVVKAN